MREAKVHRLKTWAPFFDAVVRGCKTFEGRKDDRGFNCGDILELIRCVHNPATGEWEIELDCEGKAKNTIRKQVTYILNGGRFGIEQGWVVMAIEDAAEAGL